MKRRLLLVISHELTQAVRARRVLQTARDEGYEAVGLSGVLAGETETPLPEATIVRVPLQRVSGGLRRARVAEARPGTIGRELRGVVRLLRLAGTTVRLVRAGRRLGPFDVVHAAEWETLPASRLLARRFGARLVYDSHELFMAVEQDPPRLYREVAGRLERRLAQRAGAVVTCSDGYARVLQEAFALRVRPAVVLNAPERVDSLPPRPVAGGALRAIYQAGADQPTRPLSDLLLAAKDAPNVHITIRVVHLDADAVTAAIAAAGLEERVTLAAPVPVTQLVERMSEFDAGIVLLRPDTLNSSVCQPNKLFEYMMAGLALVVPALPGMAPLVEEERIGLAYRADSPRDLARALEQLAAEPDLLAAMQKRARVLALERFNATREAEALARVWRAEAAATADGLHPTAAAAGR